MVIQSGDGLHVMASDDGAVIVRDVAAASPQGAQS
jgi:hypothetical protein